MDDAVVVVGFDTAGRIGAVSKMDKQYADETARQLRRGYKSVKKMSEGDFQKILDKEMEERRQWNMIQ